MSVSNSGFVGGEFSPFVSFTYRFYPLEVSLDPRAWFSSFPFPLFLWRILTFSIQLVLNYPYNSPTKGMLAKHELLPENNVLLSALGTMG